MASPYDDGWLLSEPLELLAVELEVNRAQSLVSVDIRPAHGPRGRFVMFASSPFRCSICDQAVDRAGICISCRPTS